jgi:hypothetical protein
MTYVDTADTSEPLELFFAVLAATDDNEASFSVEEDDASWGRRVAMIVMCGGWKIECEAGTL